MGRRKTKNETYRNMSAIRSSGSQIERVLAKELWSLGLRYRKNYKKAEGKPDFAFLGVKIAVFCDSSFWHGKNWGCERKKEFRVNRDFWIKKIERNIQRDLEVNDVLRKLGWKVLRFWDSVILGEPQRCALKVKKELERRRSLAG